MKLGPGLRFQIQNLTTPEWTHFLLHELVGYKAGYLVYGVSAAHEVHVVRGVMDVGERPSGFVLMPGEPEDLVAAFVESLLGQPLVLNDGKDVMRIVNRAVCGDDQCDRTKCRRYHHPTRLHVRKWRQQDHQRKNAEMVDLYLKDKTRLMLTAGRPHRPGSAGLVVPAGLHGRNGLS